MTRIHTTKTINADIRGLRDSREELIHQIDSNDRFRSLTDGGLSTAVDEFSEKIAKLEKLLNDNKRLEETILA